MAAAARDASGVWRALSGNEIGVLLGHHLLTRDGSRDPRRLVITTVVSSMQLKRIAAELGVRYAEALTGFKWIAHTAMELEAKEGARFVFGYEEALGYTVGTVTRDKDGIGAALIMAELAASLKAQGQTLLDRLRQLRERYGLYVGRQRSLTLPGREGAEQIRAAMQRLRAAPPTQLGPTTVTAAVDLALPGASALPPADVLIYDLAGGGKAAVRPSGTEPKIKLYLEVVEALQSGETMEQASARGERSLDQLEVALRAAAGL
jgi:phosphomannomutase